MRLGQSNLLSSQLTAVNPLALPCVIAELEVRHQDSLYGGLHNATVGTFMQASHLDDMTIQTIMATMDMIEGTIGDYDPRNLDWNSFEADSDIPRYKGTTSGLEDAIQGAWDKNNAGPGRFDESGDMVKLCLNLFGEEQGSEESESYPDEPYRDPRVKNVGKGGTPKK